MQTQEFTNWLLDADTPAIRYRTMRDLLGYPNEEPRVVAARQAIMSSGPVPALLSHQTPDGNWEGERSYYTPKYISTHWSMMLLTELNVDGDEPRFQQGIHYMLETTAGELRHRLDTQYYGLACFWGNLLRYALQAGLYGDARVEQVIHFIDRSLQNGSCYCEHNWGYACAWGAVRALW